MIIIVVGGRTIFSKRFLIGILIYYLSILAPSSFWNASFTRGRYCLRCNWNSGRSRRPLWSDAFLWPRLIEWWVSCWSLVLQVVFYRWLGLGSFRWTWYNLSFCRCGSLSTLSSGHRHSSGAYIAFFSWSWIANNLPGLLRCSSLLGYNFSSCFLKTGHQCFVTCLDTRDFFIFDPFFESIKVCNSFDGLNAAVFY